MFTFMAITAESSLSVVSTHLTHCSFLSSSLHSAIVSTIVGTLVCKLKNITWYMLIFSLQLAPDSIHATSADQDQPSHPCHLILLHTVHHSVKIYFEIFPKQFWMVLSSLKKNKSIYNFRVVRIKMVISIVRVSKKMS
jgi:hypothetical protein